MNRSNSTQVSPVVDHKQELFYSSFAWSWLWIGVIILRFRLELTMNRSWSTPGKTLFSLELTIKSGYYTQGSLVATLHRFHLELTMDSSCYTQVLYLGFACKLPCTRVTILGFTLLHNAIGNVSGYRCVSDCRSRGGEFDRGPVPSFRGNWLWNNFYGYTLPFRWIIQ